MAYTKQNFIDGEVLTAAKLNHMEDGIGDAYIKPSAGVPTSDIADGAVTSVKIADNAVSDYYTANIGTTWEGDNAPYTQTITVMGVTNNDKPIVGVVYSDIYETAEAQRDAWSQIYRIVATTNLLTVYATDKTETEIPVQFTCVRK